MFYVFVKPIADVQILVKYIIIKSMSSVMLANDVHFKMLLL